MSQDEVLRMVVSARDDASGPIRKVENALRGLSKRGGAEVEQFRKNLRSVQGQLGKVSDAATKGVGKRGVGEIKNLGDGWRQVRDELNKVADVAKAGVAPAMEAIGLSSLSAVGAAAALVAGLKKFADSGTDVAAFGRRVQFTTDTIRGLEGAAEEFHIDPASVRQGLQGFAEAMFLIRRHQGTAYKKMQLQNPGLEGELVATPETIEGNEQALKSFLKALEENKKAHGEMNARLWSRELLGTDAFVDFLREGNAGLEKAIALYLRLAGVQNTAAGEDWTRNWSHFRAAIEGVRNEIGNELLPDFTKLTSQAKDFFAANKVEIGHDIVASIKEIGAAMREVNAGVQVIGGWKPVFEGLIALKLAGLAVNLLKVVGALGRFAGLASPPGWAMALLGISAAGGAVEAEVVSGMKPEDRKALYEDPTLATMNPDLAMGAAIMDQTNRPPSPSPPAAEGSAAQPSPGLFEGWHAIKHPKAPPASIDTGRGAKGFWTSEHIQYAIDYLKKNAALPELGARALVARWAAVESPGAGPSAVNPTSGAIGIHQALGSRKAGIVLGDFEGQLARVTAELKGPEARAYRMLIGAQNALQAATGASQFERAEGYNPATGADAFVAKTVAAMRALPQAEKQDSGSLLAAAADASSTAEAAQRSFLEGWRRAQASLKEPAAPSPPLVTDAGADQPIKMPPAPETNEPRSFLEGWHLTRPPAKRPSPPLVSDTGEPDNPVKAAQSFFEGWRRAQVPVKESAPVSPLAADAGGTDQPIKMSGEADTVQPQLQSMLVQWRKMQPSAAGPSDQASPSWKDLWDERVAPLLSEKDGGAGQQKDSLLDQSSGVPGSLLAAAAKSQMDSASGKVTGSASLDVKVSAPKGTTVKARADGLFDRVTVNRGQVMPEASRTD